MKNLYLYVILFFFDIFPLCAQRIPNPVLPGVADAGVLKYNGKYYIGGVHTNGDFYVSTDLIHWSGPTHVVTMDNDWTRNTGARNNQIHANDITYLNGTFYQFWSVNYWGNDKHIVHITKAESDSILGPYLDHDKSNWMENRIDPMLFKDDDGKLYLYMVKFTDGNAVWVRKMLSPSQFASEPISLFASLPSTWETMDNRVAEGPWVIKYHDRYYMMYNANHTSTEWGNYQLGVAEADSPISFQNGNKYSAPVVTNNQFVLEQNYVDLLRYTGDKQFHYTTVTPIGDWQQLNYNDKNWMQGKPSFVQTKIQESYTRHFGTLWNTKQIWVRKTFNLKNKETHLALRIGHDGPTCVYLNGKLVYTQNSANYTILNLDDEQTSELHRGNNLLAVYAEQAKDNYLDIALFDMHESRADDILMTPGQPNIVRGPNGFEWWLVYMGNKNNEPRGQFVNQVYFRGHTMKVDGMTSSNTPGYHSLPAEPTFSILEETTDVSRFTSMPAATTYLLETNICNPDRAFITLYSDANREIQLTFDRDLNILSVLDNGSRKQMIRFSLPESFRWDVYHALRIEKRWQYVDIWIDGIKVCRQFPFLTVAEGQESVSPRIHNVSGNSMATFEGTIYTVGFDMFHLLNSPSSGLQILTNQAECYQWSFEWNHLTDDAPMEVYPIYLNEKNYVAVHYDSLTDEFVCRTMCEGHESIDSRWTTEQFRTLYTDVKYSDFIEKVYTFENQVWMDCLLLPFADADRRDILIENPESLFIIEYKQGNHWIPLPRKQVIPSTHPAYQTLKFPKVQTDGLRLINKQATDMDRHIYQLRIHETAQGSHQLRFIKTKAKLLILVDGVLKQTLDIPFEGSSVALGSGHRQESIYGMMYYETH